ncbi:hypothetical protein D3C80_592720 [compost metagenome]
MGWAVVCGPFGNRHRLWRYSVLRLTYPVAPAANLADAGCAVRLFLCHRLFDRCRPACRLGLSRTARALAPQYARHSLSHRARRRHHRNRVFMAGEGLAEFHPRSDGARSAAQRPPHQDRRPCRAGRRHPYRRRPAFPAYPPVLCGAQRSFPAAQTCQCARHRGSNRPLMDAAERADLRYRSQICGFFAETGGCADRA